MNKKTKAVTERIERIQEAIGKGREYLDNGSHADWQGFRPLFTAKIKDGNPMPPHRDWVKNVFLPQEERALRNAEKALRALECKEGERENQRRQKSEATGLIRE